MQYEVAIIGGGLAGSVLGRSLAEAGVRVLILERQTRFKDRIRGETTYPWGVSEAARLGVEQLLRSSCACSVGWWQSWLNGERWIRRNLIKTTPARAGCLNFFHPEMQENLLQAAEEAGAEVRRGASVTEVIPGGRPQVRFHIDGSSHCARASLLVGADGRHARTRRWAGFSVQRAASRLSITGVLVEGLRAPEDCLQFVQKFPIGQTAILPIGAARFRMYCMLRQSGEKSQLERRGTFEEFTRACLQTGVPADWLEGARAAGPLASFDCAETWVAHPFREGVALIGDAAATNDPSWGCGLALSLRDARVLRDSLLGSTEWTPAAHAYAAEHDAYYGALRCVQSWMAELFYEPGEQAEERRSKTIPILAAEPARVPDLAGLGPESPHDNSAKRRFFCSEAA